MYSGYARSNRDYTFGIRLRCGLARTRGPEGSRYPIQPELFLDLFVKRRRIGGEISRERRWQRLANWRLLVDSAGQPACAVVHGRPIQTPTLVGKKVIVQSRLGIIRAA